MELFFLFFILFVCFVIYVFIPEIPHYISYQIEKLTGFPLIQEPKNKTELYAFHEHRIKFQKDINAKIKYVRRLMKQFEQIKNSEERTWKMRVCLELAKFINWFYITKESEDLFHEAQERYDAACSSTSART